MPLCSCTQTLKQSGLSFIDGVVITAPLPLVLTTALYNRCGHRNSNHSMPCTFFFRKKKNPDGQNRLLKKVVAPSKMNRSVTRSHALQGFLQSSKKNGFHPRAQLCSKSLPSSAQMTSKKPMKCKSQPCGTVSWN